MIRDPEWLRAHVGDKTALPRSDAEGVKVAQGELVPLRAQIAIYSGSPEGTLSDLQSFARKMIEGKPVICSVCNRNIPVDLHLADCPIVAGYTTVMTSPPGERRTFKRKNYTPEPLRNL